MKKNILILIALCLLNNSFTLSSFASESPWGIPTEDEIQVNITSNKTVPKQKQTLDINELEQLNDMPKWNSLVEQQGIDNSEALTDSQETPNSVISPSEKVNSLTKDTVQKDAASLLSGKTDISATVTNKSVVIDPVETIKIEPVFSKAGAVVITEQVSAYPGEEIKVKFSNGPGGQGDWIAMCYESANNDKRISHQYIKGQKQGELTFKVPVTTAKIQFRLLTMNGHFATSNSVSILPLLKTPKEPVKPKEGIDLQYSGISGSAKEWIGLYSFDKLHASKFISRQQLAEGKTSGMIQYPMPEAPGKYFFCLFQYDERNNHEYKPLSASEAVVVGDSVIRNFDQFRLEGKWKRTDGVTMQFKKNLNGSYSGIIDEPGPLGNFGFYKGELTTIIFAGEASFSGVRKLKWTSGHQEWKKSELLIKNADTYVSSGKEYIRQ